MSRRVTATLLAALLTTLSASPCGAGSRQLTDDELGAERGGIETPFGFDIGFGASVRTFVNGDLALETTLTWTPQGPRTTSLSNSDLGQVTVTTGAMAQLLIPGGVNGMTQVLHEVDGSRIVSLVLNTANGQTIRQDTDITLSVPSLTALQQQMGVQHLALTLNAALGAGLSSSTGH